MQTIKPKIFGAWILKDRHAPHGQYGEGKDLFQDILFSGGAKVGSNIELFWASWTAIFGLFQDTLHNTRTGCNLIHRDNYMKNASELRVKLFCFALLLNCLSTSSAAQPFQRSAPTFKAWNNLHLGTFICGNVALETIFAISQCSKKSSRFTSSETFGHNIQGSTRDVDFSEIFFLPRRRRRIKGNITISTLPLSDRKSHGFQHATNWVREGKKRYQTGLREQKKEFYSFLKGRRGVKQGHTVQVLISFKAAEKAKI